VLLTTFSDFLNYCRSLKNETLYTGSRNKPFYVEVEGNSLWFVPLSSGTRRRANPEKTELVLSQLNKTDSYSPGSYKSITFHASYILGVANKHAKTA